MGGKGPPQRAHVAALGRLPGDDLPEDHPEAVDVLRSRGRQQQRSGSARGFQNHPCVRRLEGNRSYPPVQIVPAVLESDLRTKHPALAHSCRRHQVLGGECRCISSTRKACIRHDKLHKGLFDLAGVARSTAAERRGSRGATRSREDRAAGLTTLALHRSPISTSGACANAKTAEASGPFIYAAVKTVVWFSAELGVEVPWRRQRRRRRRRLLR